MSEQIVGIAEKMYSARRSLRSLLPEKFTETCEKWQVAVQMVMREKDMSEIAAMIEMLRILKEKPVAQLWLLAAVVEMLEPST